MFEVIHIVCGNTICYNILANHTYIRFHRMHEMTSTAMEETTPITADRTITTSMATTVSWGYSAHSPHTGRHTETFLKTLQEKPSWHWSMLQFKFSGTRAVGRGSILVSFCLPLPLPKRWKSLLQCVHVCVYMLYVILCGW